MTSASSSSISSTLTWSSCSTRRRARYSTSSAVAVTSDDVLGLQEPRHRVRRLRPLGKPVLDLRLVELDQRRVRLRVVPADDLDELPVPRRPGVRDHDPVDRVLLRPDTGQSHAYCHPAPFSAPPGQAGERRHLALAHLLHQLLHLLARVQEPGDLLDGRAAAPRDALAPRPVDSVRETALTWRHRQDDRLDAGQFALVDLESLQLVADTR